MANKKRDLSEEIEVPEGIEVKVERGLISVKGPKGELKRRFALPTIDITLKDKQIMIKPKRNTQREKKLIGTFKANTKNMFKGVKEAHHYSLKICSGHFPMKVESKGDIFSISNFLGEKDARILKLKPGVTVKVEGDKINVESIDKNLAGQTAASIEQLTRRPGFDIRIFQDGIYIINIDGKDIK